jgi:hypothetical protein
LHVRIRGIDTPELRGECASEKAMAAQARDRLARLAGESISIAHIADDKYAGRVIADAAAADGTDLRVAMLASGLARPYDGGTRGARSAVSAARGSGQAFVLPLIVLNRLRRTPLGEVKKRLRIGSDTAPRARASSQTCDSASF